MYNRNISFHRFPEYFRKYIYWQVNLRSREELNKEKGLNFPSNFLFTTFSTFLEWNFWFLALKIKYHCLALLKTVFQFSSVTQLGLTLCDPMDCSTPGLPVHHQLTPRVYTIKQNWESRNKPWFMVNSSLTRMSRQFNGSVNETN